ncbi:hypothetical protein PSDVSF_26060 [Pseudodesulfovibrio sediminis]|uniref:Secreted protein n=1 Tax=Pseudodesulfovibrio sediminis TaxID=2810563 RepID=A0ABM9SE12_9BACT|nr:hypothetical protein PSDVSF_26060 [Pseudodesulfovibrio sediminis]
MRLGGEELLFFLVLDLVLFGVGQRCGPFICQGLIVLAHIRATCISWVGNVFKRAKRIIGIRSTVAITIQEGVRPFLCKFVLIVRHVVIPREKRLKSAVRQKT